MLTVWTSPKQDDSTPTPAYSLAANVTFVLIDDGTARLFHMGGGFFALPVIGAQMLRGALENGSGATIAELADRYQVGPEQVRGDLDALLKQLQDQGLLQTRGRRCRECAPGLALVLIPLLCVIRRVPFPRLRAFSALTLAKLAVACFGLARTIGAFRISLRRLDLPNDAPIDEEKARALDRAVRDMASLHLIPMACKERGLACWALSCWAGVPSTLVIGLELFPLAGHCWCEAGSLILSDYDDICEMYTPVLRYRVA